MIRKTHLSLALAGLALAVGSGAQACTTAQWGQQLTAGQGATAGVIAGQPNGAGGGTSLRYSGLCGLRATAAGQMVRDGTPAAEADYIARFYVRPAVDTGTHVVFRVAEGAPDGANTMVYRVQYNRANQQFEVVNSANAVTAIGAASSAPNAKWYEVKLTWHRTGGTLDVSVQGNASSTPNAVATGLTGFGSSGGATGPDYAELGWVGAPVAGTGTIEVDAFESRRSTAIPRLCRGDANNDNNRNSGDGVTVRNEFLSGGTTLSAGQADCNEDGAVNSGDGVCIRNIFLGGLGACSNAI